MESSSFSSSFFLPCGWPFVCLLVPFYFPPFSWRGMKIGIFCSMGNDLACDMLIAILKDLSSTTNMMPCTRIKRESISVPGKSFLALELGVGFWKVGKKVGKQVGKKTSSRCFYTRP